MTRHAIKLLADAGNSRLKLSWMMAGAQTRATEVVAFGYDDLQAASAWVATLPAQVLAIFGVSVVDVLRRQQIEAALLAGSSLSAVYWLDSQAQAGGVRNGYAIPQQLGADRWVALLGVAAHERQRLGEKPRVPVLLASFGTATTLDALLPFSDPAGCHDCADYAFPGGLILPGVDLMAQALAQGTAHLPQVTGRLQTFPTSTENAIMSGIVAAQVGALWWQWQQLCRLGSQPRLYVTGGAWDSVQAGVGTLLADVDPVWLSAPTLDGLVGWAAVQA